MMFKGRSKRHFPDRLLNSFTMTTTCHLLIYGDVPSAEVIRSLGRNDEVPCDDNTPFNQMHLCSSIRMSQANHMGRLAGSRD